MRLPKATSIFWIICPGSSRSPISSQTASPSWPTIFWVRNDGSPLSSVILYCVHCPTANGIGANTPGAGAGTPPDRAATSRRAGRCRPWRRDRSTDRTPTMRRRRQRDGERARATDERMPAMVPNRRRPIKRRGYQGLTGKKHRRNRLASSVALPASRRDPEEVEACPRNTKTLAARHEAAPPTTTPAESPARAPRVRWFDLRRDIPAPRLPRAYRRGLRVARWGCGHGSAIASSWTRSSFRHRKPSGRRRAPLWPTAISGST